MCKEIIELLFIHCFPSMLRVSDCKIHVQLCNMDKLRDRCLSQASYHTILHFLDPCALCTSHRHLHPSSLTNLAAV